MRIYNKWYKELWWSIVEWWLTFEIRLFGFEIWSDSYINRKRECPSNWVSARRIGKFIVWRIKK